MAKKLFVGGLSYEEEAKKAIEMFNGKKLDGKNVTVNEARPMDPRPRQGGFGREGRGFGGNRRKSW